MRIGNMLDFDVRKPRLVLADAQFQSALNLACAFRNAVDDLREVGDAVAVACQGHAGAAVEDAFEVLQDGVAEGVEGLLFTSYYYSMFTGQSLK